MTTNKLPLWEGEFGDKYRERNKVTEEMVVKRTTLWENIFNIVKNNNHEHYQPEYLNVFELGAGGGSNVIALDRIFTFYDQKYETFVLEPNIETEKELFNNCKKFASKEPIFTRYKDNSNEIMMPSHSMDLVFTSGVLIHIHPDKVLDTMKELYRISRKYIVCIEYFSPELREQTYHNEQALWTNDYGSLWLDNFPLKCEGYFFVWKRITTLDNLTVWIFKKVN